MPTAQLVILFAGNVFVLATLAGLLVRRRLPLGYCFAIYLVAVVVLSTPPGLSPGRFNTWSFYWFKQSVYALLEMAVAIELTVRVFQAFPAARRTARTACLVILALTLIAAWSAPTVAPARERAQEHWADLALVVHPRIANGTAWLFGVLFALILYYRLPLHPLHKAVAFGFMSYLLLLTFGLDLVKRSEFGALGLVSYASGLGYTLVAAYWAWAAWRRDEPPPVDRAVVERLQPWR